MVYIKESLLISPGEPERFYLSLAANFDLNAPLRWGFLLHGASEDQVGPLMAEVSALGFPEIEPTFDEEREGRYVLWFAEVRVHSAQSFTERVAAVEQFAARHGLVVSDYSAGRLQ